MPQERFDPAYARRSWRMFLQTAGINILVVGLVFLLLRHIPQSDLSDGLLVFVCLGTFAWTTFRGWVVGHRFYCPECGTLLRRHKPPTDTSGEQRFFCQDCDTLWNTRLYDNDRVDR
jgi:hypothetical protein